MWRWARSTQRSPLEIGGGVFKRLGDCTGSEIESAIGLKHLIAYWHIAPAACSAIQIRFFDEPDHCVTREGTIFDSLKFAGTASRALAGVGLLADRAFHL